MVYTSSIPLHVLPEYGIIIQSLCYYDTHVRVSRRFQYIILHVNIVFINSTSININRSQKPKTKVFNVKFSNLFGVFADQSVVIQTLQLWFGWWEGFSRTIAWCVELVKFFVMFGNTFDHLSDLVIWKKAGDSESKSVRSWDSSKVWCRYNAHPCLFQKAQAIKRIRSLSCGLCRLYGSLGKLYRRKGIERSFNRLTSDSIDLVEAVYQWSHTAGNAV